MSERTWRQWMLAAAATTVGVGCVFVVLALVGVPATLMDVLFLPGQPDVATAATVSFAIGVTGAVMAGWGTSMLAVYLDTQVPRRPVVARAFLSGVLLWFALDGVVSLSVGATINLVGNLLFLALLVPPLTALSRRGSPAD